MHRPSCRILAVREFSIFKCSEELCPIIADVGVSLLSRTTLTTAELFVTVCSDCGDRLTNSTTANLLARNCVGEIRMSALQ